MELHPLPNVTHYRPLSHYIFSALEHYLPARNLRTALQNLHYLYVLPKQLSNNFLFPNCKSQNVQWKKYDFLWELESDFQRRHFDKMSWELLSSHERYHPISHYFMYFKQSSDLSKVYFMLYKCTLISLNQKVRQ